MSNCHKVCLIWSRKTVIVMKHQWKWAKKGVWAIHGTIHPFIALGFPHSVSRKCSRTCEGWMWAGEGWQQCWGNHCDKWCISALHCALCFDTMTPLWSSSVELRCNKGWLFYETVKVRFQRVDSSVSRILTSGDFQHIFKLQWLMISILHQATFVLQDPIIGLHGGFRYCPLLQSFKGKLCKMLPFSALPWLHKVLQYRSLSYSFYF